MKLNLKSILNTLGQKTSNNKLTYPPTPVIFSTQNTGFEARFTLFLEANPITRIFNTYEKQLAELFHIRHPQLDLGSSTFKVKYRSFKEDYLQGKDPLYLGVWVYYPWTGNLDHFLPPEEYQEIRTARNKFLVTSKEQETFRKYVVGIAGLSLGNSIALSLVYSGGCEQMKLADPDSFSATNLNRVRVPAYYIGVKKVYVAAQQIYEINPYAKLVLYPEGLNEHTIKEFFISDPKLQLVVDEMDDLKMKIFIRLAARAVKIPLVMATDNGDNAIIDIERFDHTPYTPSFKGMPLMDLDTVVKGITYGESLNLNILEKVRLATRLVGAKNATPRMQDSLMRVGKDIVSWPQLGISALTGGTILTYVIKKIALGGRIQSGKTHIPLDQLFTKDYSSKKKILARRNKTKRLEQYINNPKLIPYENYSLWNISERNYPKNSTVSEKIKFILKYALMAPSSHNTQPWRFSLQGNSIKLYADISRELTISDPTRREMYISLGACLMNLLIALDHFSFSVNYTLFPTTDPLHVATIVFSEDINKKSKQDDLFRGIMLRFSDKQKYLSKDIPKTILDYIKQINQDSVLEVKLITDIDIKVQVAQCVQTGEAQIMENDDFRTELSQWLRHNYTRKENGMPGFTAGIEDIQSIIGPFLIKHFNMSTGVGVKQKLIGSPLLVIVASTKDSPTMWVRAGMVYEQIVLYAATKGIHNGTLASIIELETLNKKVTEIIGISKSKRIQVFFRLGFSNNKIVRSPRIPLENILEIH